MRAVVAYESMYGNTRTIAEKVGAALSERYEVDVRPVREVTADVLNGADLLVVGAPTHMWSLSRPKTRQAAVKAAAEQGSGLVLQPGAEGTGVREWIDALPPATGLLVAVFDTRMKAPALFTGRASREIWRRMRRRGYDLIDQPTSFLVSKKNSLLPDESDRASAWGTRLGHLATAPRTRH